MTIPDPSKNAAQLFEQSLGMHKTADEERPHTLEELLLIAQSRVKAVLGGLPLLTEREFLQQTESCLQEMLMRVEGDKVITDDET